MNTKQADQALKALDKQPARNWRERQQKARVAARLHRLRRKVPEPYDETLPF